MAKTEFDYYYGAESEQFSFVRVPRVLFTDKEHFGSLSNDARILYGFLLERMSLSRRNNWIDELNRVYIVFPIEEIEELLGVSHDKANNLLKELDDVKGIGLVSKKRRGLGLPSILYVKNFILNSDEQTVQKEHDTASEPEKKADETVQTSRSPENGFQEVRKTDFLKSENQTSGSQKNRLQEVSKTDSNYIDINNIEKSYIDTQSINPSRANPQNFSPGNFENRNAPNVESVENSDGLIDGVSRTAVEESVKKQIDYDCFMSNPDESVVSMVDEVKDLMVDVLCGERIVVADGKRVSEETAKSAFRKITFEHVQYVLQSLVSYAGKISRIDRFLTTSLFNSVYTLVNSTFAGFEYDTGLKMM